MKLTIDEVQEGLNELNNYQREALILDLLLKKKIDFITITQLYTKYLEIKQMKNLTKKRLLAGCLATKYQGGKDNEYSDARSSLLLQPHVPDKFIKNTFKHVSKEAIEKQKKFLESELK